MSLAKKCSVRHLVLILVFPLIASQDADILSNEIDDNADGTPVQLPTFTLGAVLSAPVYGDLFLQTIDNLNERFSKSFRFNGTYIVMDDNPIQAAKDVCEQVIPSEVFVVIASIPQKSDLSPMAVSFTCGFYSIPVMGISARNSAFSDKNVHSTYLRTVAPYSDQALPLVKILEHFKWKKVVLIHSSAEEGRAILGKLQNMAEDYGVQIEVNIQYTAGQQYYGDDLIALRNVSARVFMLSANFEDAENIYRDAAAQNLSGEGYAWIVTEQALGPPNTPIGAIGLRQVSCSDEASHIKDSVEIIGQAFYEMITVSNETLVTPPKQCYGSPQQWEDQGLLIYKYLQRQEYNNGHTGKVLFNDHGDRQNPQYDVYNVQRNQTVKVGEFDYKQGRLDLQLQASEIIWPGDVTTQPKGITITTHLKVVTIQALPYIYAEERLPGEECEVLINKIPCPKPDLNGGPDKQYCCFGYAIDLLVKLSKTVNFTYDLHLVADGQFGSYERRNGSTDLEWNGMIGELVGQKADLIVAPLTIDPERDNHMDFSKPYKYQGLTILVRKATKDSSLTSFLQPFHNTLWILVGLSVHVVALVLYLLDRFSPFGRFKLAKSDDNEEMALNLSNAMWFAWGVLLNSGIGEGTPRSFSARVLGMVWAGFAMIIVASYTANLAAFLVLDRPEASISGIDDARLRNPQEKFSYATVQNSAVAMYFKRQVELSTMYRTMETRNCESAEECIFKVKQGELLAFIWDSSRLEYEAANDCDLVTAGELFGRSGYGIGLPKDSPWTHVISLALLSYHESGYMEQLDGKWIMVKDTKCPESDTSPATLGLTNMAGVFMMVAGGIVAGVFLIIIEISYKQHRGLKEKEIELARNAANRWRGNIEKRRTLRRTLMLQQELPVGWKTENEQVNDSTSARQKRASFADIAKINPGPMRPLTAERLSPKYAPATSSSPTLTAPHTGAQLRRSQQALAARMAHK